MSELDVDRLAKALNNTVGMLGWLRSTPSDPAAEWWMNARGIAAEYARLGSEAGLHEARDELEAGLAALRESHPFSVQQCAGDHNGKRSGGRTVKATRMCLFRDGHIDALCARHAYGLDGLDIVARLPIRYPDGRTS
jgi:hypothetical protein